MSDPIPPELAGLSDAEEFFDALEVRYEPRILDVHRLAILKTFGLAVEAWLATNPEAGAAARRKAIASALEQAYGVFAEEERAAGRPSPFAPRLVQLGRPR